VAVWPTKTGRGGMVTPDVYECVSLCASLTHHEAHQLVGKDTGGDESHPQADVKLPGALGLHPHEQTDR